ncbi:uncharacterized protein LOC100570325 [Acyrthosiphon pisum]|uniref:Uncharacterized protein n=1 Tax=Acyrthosiphon pisum TaxID=7029 RepID=A0A8R2AAN5_ACYPI|nr:uncharacterized protein LOC100570325 [Acyrthosiphon pisum]|eukprot:XP_003243100.3 PREDICTED: uncharacterized protein LOC100570325 [Acyrthosiphon pisum]
MNNKMNVLQSFAIVVVMFLIIFFVFTKYIPLYRLYHVNCDNFNNNLISNRNAENNTDSSPPIKFPISFLIVNFVYVYAIMIIIICFYGLYGWAATNVIVSIGKFSKQPCDIENNENSISDIILISQIVEDDKLIPEAIPLQILPETTESNATNNYHCTWVGDWNKY